MVGRDPAPLATEALRGEGAILINDSGRALHAGAASARRTGAARHRGARRVRRDRRRPRRVPRRDARRSARISPSNFRPSTPAASPPASIRRRSRSRSRRPRITTWAASRWTRTAARSLDGLWAGGEVVLHRRAWRQPAGLELAARGRGLCRAHRRGYRRPRDCRRLPACRSRRSARRTARCRRCRKPELRAMMTSHVGVIRDGDRLAEAVRAFADIERQRGNVALRNMATTALLVAASAWTRRESRGAHYRSDYPAEKPALAHRTMTTLAAARDIAASLATRRAARPAADHRLIGDLRDNTRLTAQSRSLPVAARDRRGGAARARRGSRPRRRHHLDRHHSGGDARPTPSWSRGRPASSPDCRWRSRRSRSCRRTSASRRMPATARPSRRACTC